MSEVSATSISLLCATEPCHQRTVAARQIRFDPHLVVPELPCPFPCRTALLRRQLDDDGSGPAEPPAGLLEDGFHVGQSGGSVPTGRERPAPAGAPPSPRGPTPAHSSAATYGGFDTTRSTRPRQPFGQRVQPASLDQLHPAAGATRTGGARRLQVGGRHVERVRAAVGGPDLVDRARSELRRQRQRDGTAPRPGVDGHQADPGPEARAGAGLRPGRPRPPARSRAVGSGHGGRHAGRGCGRASGRTRTAAAPRSPGGPPGPAPPRPRRPARRRAAWPPGQRRAPRRR